MRTSATADPFGTESIRARVLEAWRANPARFREDANTEQDFALGGYRDRVVVELLQNASDAARHGHVAGDVAISLIPSELLVSNTGLPITSDGVVSLASLRASAKRDDVDAVGQYGVGFAAVLAVSSEPVLASSSGSIRFSRVETLALVSEESALGDELLRRNNDVPVLRLPFPSTREPVEGFATTVALPLASRSAFESLRDTLDQIDGLTLLALPGISTLTIAVESRQRTISTVRDRTSFGVTDNGVGTQWNLYGSEVRVDGAALQELPVEERGRSVYRITWALSTQADDADSSSSQSDGFIHAPTLTDERLHLPATLVADFPLDPARRHVKRGSLTNHILRVAATTYADMVVEVAQRRGVNAFHLIPEPGFFGELDAQLRGAIRTELAARPILRSASSPDQLLTGAQATVLQTAETKLHGLLAAQIPGLVDPDWAKSRAAMQLLDPAEISLADALDQLMDARESPSWWHALYAALDGQELATLSGLPALLIDGSLTRDIRSTVATSDATTAEEAEHWVGPLGLRVIHPIAAHPLLYKLGATAVEPERILVHPAVVQRVAEATDEQGLLSLAQAVISLVGRATLLSDTPVTEKLRLPCVDGSFRTSSSCIAPQSPLAEMAANEDYFVDVAILGDPSTELLQAVGALTDLTVRHLYDVPFDPDVLAELFTEGEMWQEDAGDILHADFENDGSLGGLIPELALVAGLPMVADKAWADHLSRLSDPGIRKAIVNPTEVFLGGRRRAVPSPAAWWLRETPLFWPLCPSEVRVAGDVRLVGLLPQVTGPELDAELMAALGVKVSLTEWLAEPGGGGEVLELLARPECDVSALALTAIYQALARVDELNWPPPPSELRVPDRLRTKLVSADDVVVVSAPHHRSLIAGPVILGTTDLAEMLSVRESSKELRDIVIGSESGVPREIPPVASEVLRDVPEHYVEHEQLIVNGVDIPWWVDENGVVHAATTDGLARGLAWRAGQWQLRWELSTLLAEPDLAESAEEERSFD